MRVYLTGYMASGKSQVGAALARRLRFSFTDLDREFEEVYRISISDFFRKYDENAFRLLERKLLLGTFEKQNTIVATGGGIPCFFDNMDLINLHGISVYLEWDPAMLIRRLNTASRKRPLLQKFASGDFEAQVREHLALREPFYRQAQFSVRADRDNLAGIVEKIANLPGISDFTHQ